MGSNPTGGMNVCREYCVLSDLGLCGELITRPEESYWLWCVIVCDIETLWMRRPWPLGAVAPPPQKSWPIEIYCDVALYCYRNAQKLQSDLIPLSSGWKIILRIAEDLPTHMKYSKLFSLKSFSWNTQFLFFHLHETYCMLQFLLSFSCLKVAGSRFLHNDCKWTPV
jgi:hypothetical protein